MGIFPRSGQVRSGLDFSTKRGRQARWNRMDGFQSLKTGPDRGREGGEGRWSDPVIHASPRSQRYPGEFRQDFDFIAHVLQVPFMRRGWKINFNSG
jgi:predicted nucleic acid-binding Zn ribbon protein